jgi:hypothetical protein
MKRAHESFARSLLLCLLAGQVHFVAAQGAYLEEIYSNEDGGAQFLVVAADPGSAATTVVSTHDSLQHVYTLPANLPAGRYLIASRAFAQRYGIEADFMLPDNFLFTRGTSVKPGFFSTAIIDVPTDGTHALYTDFDYDDYVYTTRAGSAVAVNHAGKVVALAPLDVTDQVEYRHAGFDRYFVTSYPDEMSALDTGAIAGWQRTGQTIPTWTGPAVDKGLIPGTGPVCRVYVAESHFYAIASNAEHDVPPECLATATLPGAIVETWNAFYAGQPDPLTGTCMAGEAPVYRLWNPRGTGHRYTTQRAIRDDMVHAGYVVEGYGADAVTMCVAGGDGPR